MHWGQTTRAKMNSERTRKDTRATTTNIPFLAFRISPRRVERRFTPALEDAAVEVLVDGPASDIRSQGSVLVLVPFFVREKEVFEVLFEDMDFFSLVVFSPTGILFLISLPFPFL